MDYKDYLEKNRDKIDQYLDLLLNIQKELDIMISLARDCIDYLNDRIAEKE